MTDDNDSSAPFLSPVVEQAFRFAARAHRDHFRKASDLPYVVHPAAVALILQKAGVDDEDILAAALLHDTIEDVGVTREDLVISFGEDVAALVVEVTDDKSLEKSERKRLQVVNAAKKSDRAKMLKLADKASNLRALVASPPDWPVERKQEYANWAEAVAEGLRGVNETLEQELDAAITALRGHYG